MSIVVTHLTFRKAVHKMVDGWNMTKEVVAPLEIPESWGMFTPAGNKSLTKKAQRLVEKILKADAHSWPKLPFPTLTSHDAIGSFIKSYAKMSDSKSYREASDTDVREQVWAFCGDLCKCLDIETDTLETIWEDNC